MNKTRKKQAAVQGDMERARGTEPPFTRAPGGPGAPADQSPSKG